MRYFIHLGFDGTGYSGWQRQENTLHTIQEVVEKTLSRIFRERISAYGCGRTDAGVHASQYVIQFDLNEAPLFDLKFRLNKNLPEGISAFEVIEVEQNQHVRYHAKARTYDYFLHWKDDPVLYRYSSFYQDIELDYDSMHKSVAMILRTSDFRALCKHPDVYKNTLCEVTNCELFINDEQGRLRFTITSDRFLRGMIRLCITFLLKVGKGEMSSKEFADILSQETVVSQKSPALPNGLFLSKVEYPFLKLDNSHQLIQMLKVGLQ